MASSVVETNNGTTVKPTELVIKCPFLTHLGYDSANNQHYCDYESWAYGLFAIACLLLIMVPLVLIICCVAKTRNKRRIARRLRSNVSNNSYSSTEVPYRPLIRDTRRNYGTVEQECASTSISGLNSPNEESISEQPSQQHDNTSTTSSKASLLPNYDQGSLDLKNSNAMAVKKPEAMARQNTKNDISPYASSKLEADSAVSPSTEVPSKTKSPIYAVLEEASPVEQEPVYFVLEPPENDDIIKSNDPTSKNTDEKKKSLRENGNQSIDELYTIPEVNYALKSEPKTDSYNRIEPSLWDLVQTDSESTNSSPVYNILEPPLPDPESEKQSEITETENPVEEQVPEDVWVDNNSDNTKQSAECTETPEQIYTPLLLPKEKPSGNDEEQSDDTPDSSDYQALMPKRRERLTSRADYEEFLLEMIQSVPEEERNGSFVVRDSVNNPGSKALTLYNKVPNSKKEVFNFKVYFDDEQVYLAKSTKRFPSLDQLLQYLRTSKDMLPCTLTNQIL